MENPFCISFATFWGLHKTQRSVLSKKKPVKRRPSELVGSAAPSPALYTQQQLELQRVRTGGLCRGWRIVGIVADHIRILGRLVLAYGSEAGHPNIDRDHT